MTFDFTDQEHQYLLQVMLRQPVHEALPLVLKLTNQQLTPLQPPAQPQPPSLKAAS